MGIEDFKGTRPEFMPEECFLGRLEGWAVFESLIGGLQKRATISAVGEWDIVAQSVAFIETYTFDDGHTDTLRWMIRKMTRVAIAAVKRCWRGAPSANRPVAHFIGSIPATCRNRTERKRS